jgi:hypothetical protein
MILNQDDHMALDHLAWTLELIGLHIIALDIQEYL